MKKFKCGVCNYIAEAQDAPDKCPRCGAAKDKFAELSAEKANLIDRSRCTNQLHMGLIAVLDQAHAIAETGISDDLDPACAAIFGKTRDMAVELSRFIRAEIETHVKKEKWG